MVEKTKEGMVRHPVNLCRLTDTDTSYFVLQADGRTSQAVVAQLIASLDEVDPHSAAEELEVVKNVALTSYEGAVVMTLAL